jgi:hypothetical protein
MRVALGFKARTGRAILVAVGIEQAEPQLIERTEIGLLPEGASAPYHAAEGLKLNEAQRSIEKSVSAAHRLAQRAIRDAVERVINSGHAVQGCGILVGTGMPSWTTEEILAAHVRMHKAEGELFRNVLIAGARALKLELTMLPAKSCFDAAAAKVGMPRIAFRHLSPLSGGRLGHLGANIKKKRLLPRSRLSDPRSTLENRCRETQEVEPGQK